MLLSRNSDCGKNDYKMLKKAGWQAIDINETCDGSKFMNVEEGKKYLESVIKDIEDAGLIVGQCHAPMPNTYENLSDEEIENIIVSIVNCVEVASALKIPYTIVHTFIYSWSGDPDREKTFQLNKEYLKRVVEKAENTVVCLENLPGCNGFVRTGEELKEMCEAVSPKLCICIDTGHAFSNKLKVSSFFEVLGDKIKALHVHDSLNGMDRHSLPYEGSGDWNDFKEALKKYNYQGTLNSESSFSERLPKENELKWQTFEREVFETFL